MAVYLGDDKSEFGQLDLTPPGVIPVKTLITPGPKYFQVSDSCTAKDLTECAVREYGFTEASSLGSLVALGHPQKLVPMDGNLKDLGYADTTNICIFLIVKN